MNIRKNYGTTSHDMCYAEIRIDNPVLLEIFERYKALGAFEGSYHDKVFAVNANYAVYLKEQRVLRFSESPCELGDVLDFIIEMISGDWLDSTPPNNDKLNNLKAELMAKRTKIDEAYVSVRWLTYFYDMDDWYQRYRYRFDQSPWFEKFSITTQYNDDGNPNYAPWETGNDDLEGW